jgi:hypothetical protein
MGMQLGAIAIVSRLLVAWSLFAPPKVARWFFARVGTDRSYRFVFGIAAFLVGGVIAEVGGIDAIVGAFFAGLGLNKAIPEESPLMDRLQYMGSTLFIPIFLVSVGVLLEPKVLIDPKTLGIALVFTIAVLGGKALAAVIAGRIVKFTWAEVGVMSGLSGSQAAATLATTLVGAKLKLFDAQTINAVLVVILVSLIITPAMVSFFGKKVTAVGEELTALGKRVLVPVWGISSRPVLALAGRLAKEPTADGARRQLRARQVAALGARLAAQAHDPGPGVARQGGSNRGALFRVALGPRRRDTVLGRGRDACWSPSGRSGARRSRTRDVGGPGPRARAGLDRRGDVTHFDRLVVGGPDAATTPAGHDEIALAASAGPAAGRGHRIAIVTTASDRCAALPERSAGNRWSGSTHSIPSGGSLRTWREADLPLFVGTDTAHEARGQMPELIDGRFLIGQAEQLERDACRSRVTGPVVTGEPSPRHA